MILHGGANPVESHNFVWDVGTLSWIKETQPGGGGGGGTVDQGAAGVDPWLVTVTESAPVADVTATGTLDTTPGGSVPIDTNGTGVVVFWFNGVGNGQSFIVKGTQDSGVITNETLTVFNASGQSVSAFNPSTQYYVPVFGQQQVLITGQTDGSGTGTATIRLRASSAPFLKEFQFATTSTTPLLQTTIPAGNAAIAKAEDVASANGDVGVPAMAIRQSSPANTSNTNGDYEMLQMSAGRLWTSATVDAALPAGTNVIGHVIADSGSTTAVTGNVTVVQGTGTNLHTVVDSGTITAVTAITNALPAGNNNIGDVDVASVAGNVTVVQGTGTNLHVVTDSGTITTVGAVTSLTNALPAGNNNIGDVDVASVAGNVTVVQPTGTNLHAVLDSGTLTTITNAVTVTQPTGSNLHTVIDSGTVGVTNANLDVALSTLATAAAQTTGNASLSSIATSTSSTATNTAPLLTAQGATASGVLGPLVQGRVDLAPPSSADALIQPLSLDQGRRIRIISPADETSGWIPLSSPFTFVESHFPTQSF